MFTNFDNNSKERKYSGMSVNRERRAGGKLAINAERHWNTKC